MTTKKQEAGYEKSLPKRMYVWKHNALTGQIRRAEIAGFAVADSPSTTGRAKQIGRDIAALARLLQTELKTRIDPQ